MIEQYHLTLKALDEKIIDFQGLEDVSDEDEFEKKTEKYDEIFVYFDKVKDKMNQLHAPV